MHELLATPSTAGPETAGLNCFVLTSEVHVPAVPWNSRGFGSMPKMGVNICIYLPCFEQGFCFVCLRLNIPVNNFSVILGRLPGFNQYSVLSNGDEVSCSRTQHCAPCEDQTCNLAIKRPTLCQEQGFWQSFDHKSVPAVLSKYPGFGKRKVNIPSIPWLRANDWCIMV